MEFNTTAAAKPDYKVWDFINTTPLITAKATDESKTKWDTEDKSGLRYVKNGPLNVEYWRDVKPILNRSCSNATLLKQARNPQPS